MTEYPTEEDIMKAPVVFRQSTIDTVNGWKKEYYRGWKEKSDTEKFVAITNLLNGLITCYPDKKSRIKIEPDIWERSDGTTIFLNPTKVSIITAFHEFAHHIYGASEFKACRWSVWLFKTCFPLEFKTLDFRGHLLVKRV